MQTKNRFKAVFSLYFRAGENRTPAARPPASRTAIIRRPVIYFETEVLVRDLIQEVQIRRRLPLILAH